MRSALMLSPLLLAGCWLSHGIPEEDEDASACGLDETGLTCVRSSDAACGASAVVATECDPATLQWRCPTGSRPYEAIDDGETCLPFVGSGSISRLSGAPVPVPTDDGCVWLLPEIDTADGSHVAYSAVRVDDTAPFGMCPADPQFLEPGPRSTLQIQGEVEPALLPSITGAFRLPGGPARVTFRHFLREEGAPFGVRELGTGVGTWDDAVEQVFLPGADATRWAPEVDLGDAVLAVGDQAYLYGCPPPIDFLTEECLVARLDGALGAELWTGDGWLAEGDGWDGTALDGAERVFEAGPWRSAVTRIPDGRFVHLYAVGFGTRIEGDVAAVPEGPWTSLGWIAECDLPSDDDEAFCAGPAVHTELQDPLRPGEIVASYDIGTLAPDQDERRRESPEAYWPRIVRVAIP